MNLKRKKKGFTIVELVIVLAVIGILAAILIPTFVNVVNKANEAKDKSLVYNLNEALILEQIDHNGKYDTMHDTLDAMDKNQGFGIDRIKVKSKDSEILWDSVNNRFVLVTTGKNDSKTYYNGTDEINYPVLKGEHKIYEVDLWRITDTFDKNSPYSTYYTGTETSVTTSKGFDAGKTNVDVTYDNETNQNVVIRTNGGDLKVEDTSTGTIYHYGEAETVEIIECHTNSFHERAKVQFLEIEKGRIVLEAESEVNHIHINAKLDEEDNKTNEFDTVIIAKEKEVEMPTLSRDDVKIADEGTLVVALQDGTEKVTSSTQLDYVWLTKQGVYEQITISDKNDTAGTNWVNTSDKSEEKKEAAKQIANNVGRDADGNIEATVKVGETTYEVVLDSERNLVLIEENGDPEEPAYTLGNDTTGAVVVKDDNNATVEATVEVVEAAADKEAVQIGATLFAGGSGTKNDPWMIVDYYTMQNIQTMSERASEYGYNFYYKVKDGITEIDCCEDGNTWKTVNLYGHFDGNNVVFNNLVKQSLFNSVFAWENGSYIESTIKDFTVNANITRGTNTAAAISYQTRDALFSNITVHGYVEGGSNSGLFVAYGPNIISSDYSKWLKGWNVVFDNCSSDATMVNTNGAASALIGHPTCDESKSSIKVNNYQFTGNLYTTKTSAYKYSSANCGNIVYVDGSSTAISGNTNQAFSTISYTKESLPNKHEGFSVSKLSGFDHAVASLIISPNGLDEKGGFTGTYMIEKSEENELTITDTTISTTNLKFFDIKVNSDDVIETKVMGESGYTSDGNTYVVIGSSYGKTYANASVRIIQYNAQGTIIGISVFTLPVE